MKFMCTRRMLAIGMELPEDSFLKVHGDFELNGFGTCPCLMRACSPFMISLSQCVS